MSIMMDAAIFSAFLRHVNYGGYYYFLSIFTQCQLCWVELISQGFYLMSIMTDDIFLSICMLCQLWRMRLYFSICTSCQSWWMLHVKHFYVMWIMAHAIIFSVFLYHVNYVVFFWTCLRHMNYGACYYFHSILYHVNYGTCYYFHSIFMSGQLWRIVLCFSILHNVNYDRLCFSQHFYVMPFIFDDNFSSSLSPCHISYSGRYCAIVY